MTATAPTLPDGPSAPDQQSDPKVPVEPSPQEAKAIQAAEQNPDKRTLYIKRCGYGNMKFLEGNSDKGQPVYFIEVAKKFVGWDITIRRGDKSGEPILHLKKAVRCKHTHILPVMTALACINATSLQHSATLHWSDAFTEYDVSAHTVMQQLML